MDTDCTIGVLALQGAFAAHVDHLSGLGVSTRLVRQPHQLEGLHGLILPGGESTSMSNLLVSSGLDGALRTAIGAGLPVLGTCAGMILLAREIIDGRTDQISFGALDITVRRNGYGRQVDSFETDLEITSLDAPFHAVFIRAPVIESYGADVEVLADLDGHPVLVGSGRIMAASFHPELTSDSRVHELFIHQTIHPSITR